MTSFLDRLAAYNERHNAIEGLNVIGYIITETEKREQELVSAGYTLPEVVGSDLIYDGNRQEQIDKLVNEYNSSGDKKLRKYSDIESTAILKYTAKQRRAGNTEGFIDYAKDLAAQLASYAWNKPLSFAANTIAFAGTMSTGGVAISGITGVLKASGIGAAISSIPNYYTEVNRKATADILSEQGRKMLGISDESELAGTAKQAATEFVASAGLGVAGLGVKKIGESVAGKFKDASKLNIKSFNTPQETADFVSSLKKDSPSSLLTPEARINLEKDIADYADGFLNNNVEKIREVLSKHSMPDIPKGVIKNVEENGLKSTGFSANASMDKEVFKTIDSFNASNRGMASKKEALSDFVVSMTEGDYGVVFDKYAENMFSTLYRNQTSKNTIINKYKEKLVGLISNGIEPNFGGFTAQELEAVSSNVKRKAILDFNMSLRRTELAEALVSSVESRKNPSVNTLVAVVSNNLEYIDTSISNSFIKNIDNLSSAISGATKGQADKLSAAKLFDVVNGIDGSDGMQGIKGAWDKMINNINEVGVTNGVSIKRHEKYFPNRWSFQKMVGKKDAFIADMLNAVDKDAMSKVTKREVNQEFFSKMYDNLRNNDPTALSRRTIIFKDGNSWQSMHEKYGNLQTVDDVVRAINSSSKNIISNKLRGSGSVLREQMNVAKDIILKNKSNVIGADKLGDFSKKLEKESKHLFKVITNDIGDPNDSLPSFVKSLSSVYAKAKFAKSAMTAFFSDRFGTMPNAMRGIGVKNPYITSLIEAMSTSTKQELKDLYNISFSFTKEFESRFSDSSRFSMTRGSALSGLKKSFNSVYNAPQKALGWVAESNELLSMKTFGVTVANDLHLSFDKINPKLQKFLTDSGMNSNHWETLRKIPTAKIGEKLDTKLLTSNYINKLLDKGYFTKAEISTIKEARARLSIAEQAYALLSTPRSTIVGKGAQIAVSNPALQTAIIPVNLLNNITHSMYVYAYKEAAERFGTASVVPYLFLSSIVYTTASELTQNGKLPFVKKNNKNGSYEFEFDGRSAFKILNNASVLGLKGMLLEEAFGSGYVSDLKKTASVLKDLAKGNRFKALRGFNSMVNPYANLTLIGQIINSNSVDQVFGLLDPRGFNEYNNRLNKDFRSGRISDWSYQARKVK